MTRLKHYAGVLLALALLFVAFPAFAGTAAPAAMVGTISGVVAAAVGGRGLSGMKVYAQVADRFVVQVEDMASGEISGEGRVGVAHGQLYVAETASDGSFAITPLPSGTYTVWVDNAGSGYIGQYAGGAGDPASARPVPVAAGGDTGVSFDLEAGGALSGIVRAAAGGAPLAGIPVAAYAAAGGRRDALAVTAADGSYLLRGLANGSYRVVTESPEDYVNLTYGGDGGEPAAIEVLQRHTVSGIDFSLAAAARLAGFVRQSDGTPLAGVGIQAFGELSPGEFSRTATGQGTSAADGAFVINSLAAGKYRLQSRAAGNFVDLVFPRSVQVAAGETVRDLAFVLPSGGSIRGRVTSAADGRPLACARVVALDSQSGGEVRYTSTGADGSFLLERLPDGLFRVVAHLAGYEDKIYSRGLVAELSLAPGAEASGIDFALAAGNPFRAGLISGLVTAAGDGAPLGDARVSVLDHASGMVHGFACSDATGYFRAADLAPGDYRVCARGKAGFADTCVPATGGEPVTVAGEVTVGVAMPAVGSVSGRVLRQQDGTLIGRYRVANLAPGSYRLRMKTAGTGYREAVFTGASGQPADDVVAVRAGSETEGIDFFLAGE